MRRHERDYASLGSPLTGRIQYGAGFVNAWENGGWSRMKYGKYVLRRFFMRLDKCVKLATILLQTMSGRMRRSCKSLNKKHPAKLRFQPSGIFLFT